MAQIVPFIRVTHSGLYADGRPNTSSIFLTDVNFGFDNQNRKARAYVPAGGFIDIPYTSDAAFSYNQGSISQFTSAGLVTSEIVGLVPPVGTNQSFFQENPGGDGPGTYAESYSVLLPRGTTGELSAVWVRADFPAAVGETATIRIYRYRKTSAFGAFFIDQITDTFVYDSTDPWSWTIDISANIREGYDLNPITDGLVVSNVYTNTGGPTMRALRVDFRVEAFGLAPLPSTFVAPTSVAVPTWPSP